MTHTGDYRECAVALEEFLTTLKPNKPQRNHMLMVAEHLIGAFCVDKHASYTITCEVVNDSLTFSCAKNEA